MPISEEGEPRMKVVEYVKLFGSEYDDLTAEERKAYVREFLSRKEDEVKTYSTRMLNKNNTKDILSTLGKVSADVSSQVHPPTPIR